MLSDNAPQLLAMDHYARRAFSRRNLPCERSTRRAVASNYSSQRYSQPTKTLQANRAWTPRSLCGTRRHVTVQVDFCRALPNSKAWNVKNAVPLARRRRAIRRFDAQRERYFPSLQTARSWRRSYCPAPFEVSEEQFLLPQASHNAISNHQRQSQWRCHPAASRCRRSTRGPGIQQQKWTGRCIQPGRAIRQGARKSKIRARRRRTVPLAHADLTAEASELVVYAGWLEMTEYVTGKFAVQESVSGEVSLLFKSGPGLTLSLMLTADHQPMAVAQELARLLNASVAAIRIDAR